MTTQKNMDNQQSSFIRGLVVGIAVIAVLVGVYMLGAKTGDNSGNSGNTVQAPPSNTPPPSGPAAADFSKIAKVGKDDHIRGDKNAKITMIEYSDFECPFCSRFQGTVEQVLADYDGQVRLVYRHFPLSFHASAQKAAEASECAADQDSFWEMHDRLFELNNAKTLNLASIKQAAVDLGLNVGDFNDCLDSDKYAAAVQQDYQDGLAGGVSGTPGTFVNDQYLAGALPINDVKAVIDSLL